MAGHTSTVRVALIGCTGLLGDIIRQTLTEQPDFDVVAQLNAPDPEFDLSLFDADIVVWNDAEEDRIAQWLAGLTHHHAPRVLATLTDGKHAALWELTPHRSELGALSPDTLINTIRGSEVGRS